MKSIRLAAFVLPLIVLFTLSAAAHAATPAISAGNSHACALNDAGLVFCWGRNASGELGDGTTTPSPVPVAVKGLPAAASSVAAAGDSNCALIGDGTVWCWGANSYAELGNGTVDGVPTPHGVPAKVPGLTGVTQLSGGNGIFCVLLADATARCWGNNSYGEIGNASATNPQKTPIAVQSLAGIRQISAGYAHSCAVLGDGSVHCWGYNAGGILGDGTTNPSTVPVTVLNVSGAVSVYASGYTSCAILSSGAAKCWGGQPSMLGNGGVASPTAVDVLNVAGATALGGANWNNCAIAAGQQLKCWGQFPGDGSDGPANTPVDVPAGKPALAVTGNGFIGFLCFIVRGGAASCWGSGNSSGELGNGSSGPNPVKSPGQVVNLDLVTGSYASPAVKFARAGKTKLDKKKKTYSQLATLTAQIPPLLSQQDACTGSARGTTTYSYKSVKRVNGKRKHVTVKKIVKTKGLFFATGDNCVSNMTFKLPVKFLNHKKVKLKASWSGNTSMPAIAASAKTFTLPKVKKK